MSRSVGRMRTSSRGSSDGLAGERESVPSSRAEGVEALDRRRDERHAGRMAASKRSSGGSVRSSAARAPGVAASVGSSSRTEAASARSWEASAPAVRLRSSTSGPSWVSRSASAPVTREAPATKSDRSCSCCPRAASATIARSRSVGAMWRVVCLQRGRAAAAEARRQLLEGALQRLARGDVEGREDLVELDRPSRLRQRDRAAVLQLGRAGRARARAATVKPPSRNSRGHDPQPRVPVDRPALVVDLELEHGGVARARRRSPLTLPTSTPAIRTGEPVAELVRARDDRLDLVLRQRTGSAW